MEGSTVTESIGAGGDFLAAVEALSPLLRDRAEDGESRGQLADEVVEALHQVGAFGMWVPRQLGGWELDPIGSLDAISTLSYADASTGWVVMATALATGTAGAYLPDAGAEVVFGGDRLPVIAGQGSRAGTAVAVEGGYRLTGEWNFASGIKHASWIHTAAAIEGQAQRICIVPVNDADLIDNWDVMGLRATGSIDYSITDLMVRSDFTHARFIDEPVRGGNFYRLGAIGQALLGHTGWAIGVARRTLDDLANLALAKTGRPGQLVDSDTFHSEFAKAEAKARSARALAYEVWGQVSAEIAEGGRPSVRNKTLLRLALYNATWTAEEISVFAYTYAGTTALRRGPLQRLFRDIHAGTQHVTSSPAVMASVGTELAGLAPGHDWAFMSLVPRPA